MDALRARIEVMEANKASIERKHAEKQRDRDEEEAILLYQARKDELMRKREQEEKEVQDEKNRLAKAMLDSQEKIMDNSAELDALRARRYAEAKERAAREAVLKKETWRKNLAESVHKTLGDQIEGARRARGGPQEGDVAQEPRRERAQDPGGPDRRSAPRARRSSRRRRGARTSPRA